MQRKIETTAYYPYWTYASVHGLVIPTTVNALCLAWLLKSILLVALNENMVVAFDPGKVTLIWSYFRLMWCGQWKNNNTNQGAVFIEKMARSG